MGLNQGFLVGLGFKTQVKDQITAKRTGMQSDDGMVQMEKEELGKLAHEALLSYLEDLQQKSEDGGNLCNCPSAQ